MSKATKKILSFYKEHSKPIKHSLLFIGFVVVLVSLFICIINISLINNTKKQVYTLGQLENIDTEYDCILVLGCGIRADGSPTPRLNDRLTVALEAYNAGHSKVLFVTGDSEEDDYMETQAMKSFLMENGVTEDSIICDGYGLSTYESIWRAKNVYGFKNIVIVTQEYHLYRSLYIANKMGLNAIGINADLRKYSSQFKDNLRESLARVKDVIYTQMMPSPKFVEAWEELYE